MLTEATKDRQDGQVPGDETETEGETPFDGKTCVVTGASRGIGRAIAEALGSKGANVTINYRSSEAEAHAVATEISEMDGPGEAVSVQADISELDQVEKLYDRTHEAFGMADVLINNAGITADKTFGTMDRTTWDRVMEVNLGGVFNCTKTFFQDVKHADHGRVINISSVVGQQGNYGQANYATSKAGLFGFTRTLALELASTGATANCVAPGFVETDMLDSVPEQVKEKILARIPLNRFATPDDIAGIVQFLASDDASYITGQIFAANGGLER